MSAAAASETSASATTLPSASPYSYVVTAQKPTAVTHSLTANLTGPEDNNLIIAKCSRIEVHLMTPDGLTLQFDLNVYGRISVMKALRPLVFSYFLISWFHAFNV
jgi:DNA damage-binding protein 1